MHIVVESWWIVDNDMTMLGINLFKSFLNIIDIFQKMPACGTYISISRMKMNYILKYSIHLEKDDLFYNDQ